MDLFLSANILTILFLVFAKVYVDKRQQFTKNTDYSPLINKTGGFMMLK